MKLASGFCIPEPLPVHTGIKGDRCIHSLGFTLRSRDKSLATSDGSRLWHGDITSPFPPSGNGGYVLNLDVPYLSVTTSYVVTT